MSTRALQRALSQRVFHHANWSGLFHAPDEDSSSRTKGKSSFCLFWNTHALKRRNTLPKAVQLHLKTFPDDRFMLHICGLDSEEEQTFTAFPSSNVTLVREYKKGSRFFCTPSARRCRTSPLFSEHYKLRTSHILLESLGVGRGVIISPHPWMNQIIDELPERCGVAMKRWDAQSLADAMGRFHEKKTEYCEAAYDSLQK